MPSRSVHDVTNSKIYFTYMWNLKNKANKWVQQTRNRLGDTENELVAIWGERCEGRGKISEGD